MILERAERNPFDLDYIGQGLEIFKADCAPSWKSSFSKFFILGREKIDSVYPPLLKERAKIFIVSLGHFNTLALVQTVSSFHHGCRPKLTLQILHSDNPKQAAHCPDL